MSSRVSSRLVRGTVLAALSFAALTSPQLATERLGAQSAPAQPARPVFADGQAQIVPAFEDEKLWIRQTLFVETEFDSDGDGRRDRMFVDVTRPRQTDTEGLKVPVLYESSPYFAGTSGNRQFLWDVKQELGEPPPPRTSQTPIAFKATRENVSTSLVATWVPRGFAVVHSDAPGTGLSQGCPTVGSDPEQLAPKAVIDWLNGRAKGFTTIDGDEPVVATAWSTGKVGMTGTSYNGTIPLAAAVTGVKGLEAIIPVAPNTSYYHYYRSNGLVRHPGGWLGEDIDFLYDFINSGDPARREYCDRTYRDGEFARGRDRAHGDYNEFWASRDLLKKVDRIKAAVFMAHAFNDWNVVPEHSVRIYEALKGRVPLRAYYHQGGHGGAPPLEMMNKWFTRYLYGVENGVEREPKAWIVREVNSETAAPPAPAEPPPAAAGGRGRGRGRGAMPPPVSYGDYPNPDASPVTLHVRPGGGRIGGLVTRPSVAGRDGEDRRQRRPRRPCTRKRRGFRAPAPVRDGRVDGTAPSFRDVARDGPSRVEQAGGESVGVARRVAVDRRPHRPGEPHHPRLGRSAESRGARRGRRFPRARARRAARARPVLHADVRPAARRSDHPRRQAHRADDLLERSRLHALAQARHRTDDRPGPDDVTLARRRRCGGVRSRRRSVARSSAQSL